MSKTTVLAVDDNQDALYALERILVHNEFDVVTAGSGTEAFKKALDSKPAVVLMDVNMPVMDGYQAAEQFKAHAELRFIPIILVTARDALEDVVEGLNRGADDYITKPFQPEELLARLNAALRLRAIYGELKASKQKNERLLDEISSPYEPKNIIGKSPAMGKVYSMMGKLEGVDSSVLIFGPTGSGKELVAKAIHYGSQRREQVFIAKNCAAFSENLLESELFGHLKGAFTGALQDKVGLFEAANGGTLFLDEIGEMPSSLQPKLLRVLQEGTIMPVGATKEREVDVRIIAATNRNLREMVEKGEFREDLFYRLNVMGIELPSLSERKDDIGLLVEHFLQRQAEKTGTAVLEVSREAMSVLQSYRWPGNIRELQNEIERMWILGREDEVLGVEHLSSHLLSGISGGGRKGRKGKGAADDSLKGAVEELERKMILKALESRNWNKSNAAKDLGISRSNLIAKVKFYELEPENA